MLYGSPVIRTKWTTDDRAKRPINHLLSGGLRRLSRMDRWMIHLVICRGQGRWPTKIIRGISFETIACPEAGSEHQVEIGVVDIGGGGIVIQVILSEQVSRCRLLDRAWRVGFGSLSGCERKSRHRTHRMQTGDPAGQGSHGAAASCTVNNGRCSRISANR